ncbi:hypothetical protein BS50DRAFT_142216 [Corynespora cassiicola Philippines]|uniref:Uncharacterized protein n=1 Tax=Corynespora cassiicola Philippines TaxID=1448308 RepID=A0A2T2NA32_CORCC|nr:hypothetical protein BS50DRAFT_142216 [Corynespora cassiicola Philippines]
MIKFSFIFYEAINNREKGLYCVPRRTDPSLASSLALTLRSPVHHHSPPVPRRSPPPSSPPKNHISNSTTPQAHHHTTPVPQPLFLHRTTRLTCTKPSRPPHPNARSPIPFLFPLPRSTYPSRARALSPKPSRLPPPKRAPSPATPR